jgi:hypothetical protein
MTIEAKVAGRYKALEEYAYNQPCKQPNQPCKHPHQHLKQNENLPCKPQTVPLQHFKPRYSNEKDRNGCDTEQDKPDMKDVIAKEQTVGL